jgi:hypothetical protein
MPDTRFPISIILGNSVGPLIDVLTKAQRDGEASNDRINGGEGADFLIGYICEDSITGAAGRGHDRGRRRQRQPSRRGRQPHNCETEIPLAKATRDGPSPS